MSEGENRDIKCDYRDCQDWLYDPYESGLESTLRQYLWTSSMLDGRKIFLCQRHTQMLGKQLRTEGDRPAAISATPETENAEAAQDQSARVEKMADYRGIEQFAIPCDSQGCCAKLCLAFNPAVGLPGPEIVKQRLTAAGWAFRMSQDGGRRLIYCPDHRGHARADDHQDAREVVSVTCDSVGRGRMVLIAGWPGSEVVSEEEIGERLSQAGWVLRKGDDHGRPRSYCPAHYELAEPKKEETDKVPIHSYTLVYDVSIGCSAEGCPTRPAEPMHQRLEHPTPDEEPPDLKESLRKLEASHKWPFETGEPLDLAKTLMRLAARHFPPAGQLHLASALADELEGMRRDLSRAGFPTSKEATRALTAIRAELDRRIDLMGREQWSALIRTAPG